MLEFKNLPRTQVAEHFSVRSGQAPSAISRVRKDQAIERIACPSDIQCSLEPGDRRRIVNQPAGITHQVRSRKSGLHANPLSLDQKLHLQKTDRRDVEPAQPFCERPTPPVSREQPDQSAGVHENHRRRRFLRAQNRRPFEPDFQVQLPEATAGSSNSITGALCSERRFPLSR